jgi:hypothetical protein
VSIPTGLARRLGGPHTSSRQLAKERPAMGNKIIHVEVVGKDGPALQKF